MVATAPVTTVRKNLLINPRKLMVVQWAFSTPTVTTLKNPTTGALVVPDNGYVVGAHRKQRGGNLANAQTYNDIMIHGSGSPAMKIPTERRFSIGVEPVETNRQNLQNWLGADFSLVVPDAASGVHLPVPSLPINMLSRVALIGRHDFNGLACWIVWVGNRVQVTETSEQALTDAEVAAYPYSFDFQDAEDLNDEPLFVEIFGPGWDAMISTVDSGFYPALTSITMTPPTLALTAAAGPLHDGQLTVVDSNSRDRTAVAAYTTSDGSKVAVDQSGTVFGVAATVTPTSEVQTVTITGIPTGGTFTLTFAGQTTTPIAYNAAAGAVQTALQALSTIGAGNATVSGSAGGPYTVTFAGTLAQTNVAQITADGSLLTGGTAPAVATATTTQGVAPVLVTATLQGQTDTTVVTVT